MAAGFGFALGWWWIFLRRRIAGGLFRRRQMLRGVYVEPGLVLANEGNIEVEPGVVIQQRATLSTRPGSTLVIGANSRIGPDIVIAVADRVTIGRSVLTAARCYISDHNHAFTDPARPIMEQGMTAPEPVTIGDGTWLGINVCVLAGVSLGRNCVVAANSVVTKSFPERSVVGGVPARLLQSGGEAP